MSTRIGINGFGRMGRLALRAGWGRPDLQFVHVNEVAGGPKTAAHLLTFDSVHGRWDRRVDAVDGTRVVEGIDVESASTGVEVSASLVVEVLHDAARTAIDNNATRYRTSDAARTGRT